MFKKKFIIIFIFVLTIIFTVGIKKVKALPLVSGGKCPTCGHDCYSYGYPTIQQATTCSQVGVSVRKYTCSKTNCLNQGHVCIIEYLYYDPHTPIYYPDNGYCTDTCILCGEMRNWPGHICYVTTKKPTCTEDGYTHSVCECGYRDIDNEKTIPATGHINQSSIYVDPTCEESGYYEFVCEDCGENVRNNFVWRSSRA